MYSLDEITQTSHRVNNTPASSYDRYEQVIIIQLYLSSSIGFASLNMLKK